MDKERHHMMESTTRSLPEAVEAWIADARRRIEQGTFSQKHLDRLLKLVRKSDGRRQQLLYLHAASPSIYAPLVGGARHEPVAGAIMQIDPMAPELPYKSVHDALVDGWRTIHFPQQLAPFNDREIDIIGYEFILEKLEVYHD